MDHISVEKAMSFHELNLGTDNVLGTDDCTMSDLSLDTCFRVADGVASDESDDEGNTEQRRTFHNSDPTFNQNMMAVSSVRNSKRGSGKRLKPLSTMDDLDVNNESEESKSKFKRPAMIYNEEKLDSTNISDHDPDFNPGILNSKELFNLAVEAGEGSMRNLSNSGRKAKEFEDIVGRSNNLLDFQDKSQNPFLSGDDDPLTTKRRKKKKPKKKERREIDWNEADEKVKASLTEYDGAEGNLYPQISRTEAEKFRGSGNAWLEGRYSTSVDWKRNATGMTLELPTPQVKEEKLNRPDNTPLVTDRILQENRAKLKTMCRTEISVGAPMVQKLTAPDSTAPLSNLDSTAPKQSDGRGLFFRDNSMSSSLTNSRSDDEGPLLSASAHDALDYASSAQRGMHSHAKLQRHSSDSSSSRRDKESSSSHSIGNLAAAEKHSKSRCPKKERSEKKGRTKTKKADRRSSHESSDDGALSMSELAPLGTATPEQKSKSKKERPTRESRSKIKNGNRRSSFESCDDGTAGTSELAPLVLEKKKGVDMELIGEDYLTYIDQGQSTEVENNTKSDVPTQGLSRISSGRGDGNGKVDAKPSFKRAKSRRLSLSPRPDSIRRGEKKKGDDLEAIGEDYLAFIKQGQSTEVVNNTKSDVPSQGLSRMSLGRGEADGEVDAKLSSKSTKSDRPSLSPHRHGFVREGYDGEAGSNKKASAKISKSNRRRSDKFERDSKQHHRRNDPSERGDGQVENNELDVSMQSFAKSVKQRRRRSDNPSLVVSSNKMGDEDYDAPINVSSRKQPRHRSSTIPGEVKEAHEKITTGDQEKARRHDSTCDERRRRSIVDNPSSREEIPAGSSVEDRSSHGPHHSASNRDTSALDYSSAPFCPQALSDGIPTSYKPPVEELSRLRRHRSLIVGGEVISSAGGGATASTSVRKENESHQYVQFAGGSRKQQPRSVASITTKSSFLSRFTKRFEAETAKPLARRAMMQRAQSDYPLKRVVP